MNLRKLLLTENACYKAGRKITVKGIMVHSTGANNPNLKRYVGPDDGLLGENQYGNHWNTYHPGGREVCVHGFIGKLKDGSIATYQTLPWDHRGWHAGGSANNTHIGFEICEDGLADSTYFKKVYQEAVELCAYLCKEYGLTEKDIICHSEGYKRGIASNHGDVMHWFPKHGKSMDTFRADVKSMLASGTVSTPTEKPQDTTSVEKTIWDYLYAKIGNAYGTAGLMGNLYAESSLKPTNLQNTYEKKLGYTDTAYTEAVDNDSYGNFVKDSAGYGLAQWTYWSRKQALLEFAKSQGKSIGDLSMQLDFIWKELSESYKGVLATLKSATSVREASTAVLTKYERPADMSGAVKAKRASYGQAFYDAYTTEKEVSTMSNSPLVTYTNITKNKTSPRNHAIDTITIHCIVGQWTAKQGCDYFATTDRECSANYIVGKDGSIGLSVDEKDRSWCTSSRENDNRAITIEVASDTEHPYAVTDAAYSALIKLVADICQRNGIKQLVWSTNKADRVNHVNGCNMTVHRDYANKACPGQYLYERHGAIAAAVNAILGSGTTQTPEAAPEAVQGFPETPFTVRVIVPDLNYRKGPGMSYAVKGQTGKGVFTITEVQDGWGKLKSGAGWIYLENPDYCTILGVAAKPPDPDPADVLAEEIAGKVKGSGLDPEDILNRVEKILGVA